MKLSAALIAILTIVWSPSTFAQGSDNVEFYKWDISGSLGVLGTSRRAFDGARNLSSDTELDGLWSIDFGRYFTPHLKAEAGVTGTAAGAPKTPPRPPRLGLSCL